MAATCRAGMGDCMSDIRELLGKAEYFDGFQETYIKALEHSSQQETTVAAVAARLCTWGKVHRQRRTP